MKYVWLILLCLFVGYLVGASLRPTPTAHECISVCLEELEQYNETIDYD